MEDDVHESILEWIVKERWIELKGVKPAKLPHRGTGVVATKSLKVIMN
jgi:hypothetical protein